MLLADRFHLWPGDLDRVPLVERLRYLLILGAEARIKAVCDDTEPGETIYWQDDEDED